MYHARVVFMKRKRTCILVEIWEINKKVTTMKKTFIATKTLNHHVCDCNV